MKRKKKAKLKKPRTVKRKIAPSKHVVIGPLHAIAYERNGEKFLHKFTKDRPTLTCSMDGSKMFIEGGKYLWTPLGVE